MNRVVKVFAVGAAQSELAARHQVVERYHAFVVLEVAPAEARSLAQRYLTEDITDQYAIPLGGQVQATIDTSAPRITTRGRSAAHPAYRRQKRLAPGPHHYLVQFIGPVKPEWLDAVRKAGGQVVDTHSGFTVVVRADEPSIARVAGLPGVRWAGHLPPQARLDVADPDAVPLPRTRLLSKTLVVEFFTPLAARKARAEVRRLGFRILADESSAGVFTVEQSEGTRAQQQRQLDALARVHGVRVVRRKALNRISNDVAVGIVHGSPAAMGAVSGVDGEGEVVAICDTGFDIGRTNSAHPDFAGRVAFISSYPITPEYAPDIRNPGADDGPADLDSGHGTHVAGSAVGDGTASVALPGQVPIRGIAHKARLVFQAVEQALDWRDPRDLRRYGRYVLAGIPADITPVFAQAFRHRARIHSNSWGGGEPGAYDAQCRQLDQFVWDHPTMCILVAAGNDGTDSDGDGDINLMSVTSPATAKNCITVGACESVRRAFDADTYGQWWPDDYPAPPYKGAAMANDPDQVVAFSSRGPTTDGRMKPDVVAPGTWILSAKSTMLSPTETGWRPYPPSSSYFYMGGTSMATPLTAGAVAALRQHLRRDRAVSHPSAALLKAVLIAGVDRLPGTSLAGAIVDPHQGFGRVNLAAIVNPRAGISLLLEQGRTVVTGASRRTTVNVAGPSTVLRAVLAYSDFPGSHLVNNLNLVVTGPDGRVWAGNQAAGASPALDNVNNVEVVTVPDPAVGQWTIDVIGSNVPRGPQRYALAVRGPLV